MVYASSVLPVRVSTWILSKKNATEDVGLASSELQQIYAKIVHSFVTSVLTTLATANNVYQIITSVYSRCVRKIAKLNRHFLLQTRVCLAKTRTVKFVRM